MNILLIGNLAEDRQESMTRFTDLLQAGLRARDHHVTLLAPTLRLARFGPRYRYGGLPKYLGYFDKFALFPRELRRTITAARPDVVHLTDQAGAVYRSALQGVPALATCHDLLQIRAARGEIPQQQPGRAGRRYQAWILANLARMPHLACVSDYTRADALRLTGLPPARISVIPNALNYPYQPIPADTARARLAALRLDPALFDAARGGFLLQIGGGHWYKNRPGLLAIYADLRRRLAPAPPPALVMVGPSLSAQDGALVAALGISQHLVPLSGLSNAELEALYNLAEGLIFPSWAEGFGWPLAEAQACGCPAFASARAPMTEVGGRSTVYFDPADSAAAGRAIAAAWPTRTALRPLALAEAPRWRPGLMLDAYEALYRQLTL
ncbi:MAG: glycosyltransferase family 4 protein [Undibacterium sp.]|nr:glycosyltransferase family 4 protein [Opitutaceae bacterium]